MKSPTFKLFGSFAVASVVLAVAACSRTEKDAPTGAVAKSANPPKNEQKAAPQNFGPLTEKQRQTIQYTLRQLDEAANQIYLQEGKTRTTYAELVGPQKLISQVEQVAGEDYRKIAFEHGKPISVTTASGEVVTLAR